ncbi:ATP-grasp domain-containing protein [Actinoplanes sp. NPDC023801]|uniref:ATP-grasp domain-containing protein n=1 Tax=Actinoplanes sp. NPDC023801 TaxID=3154595 RepID=UPI0033D626C7
MNAFDRRLRKTYQNRTTTATVRRRRLVLLEMIGAVIACVGGYVAFVDPVRRFEVGLASKIIDVLGVDQISGALGDSFVVFGPDLEPVVAEMTGSCSVWSSVLALAALAAVALRQRPQALTGFLAAAAFVLAANQVRLLGSLLAGRYFAVDALVFFHDWIGAVLNFAYTLIGLLIMIGLTMYDAQRAEQDRAGRHTADRPAAWARPGLGHRVALEDEAAGQRDPGLQIAAVVHRRILPKALSRRLARRREQRRIDYRVGHETPARRAEVVRELAAKGLGVHTATLLAVASYETDPLVLDALAGAVAARQWEPVAGGDVIALRLWARAWLMRAPRERTVSETGRLIAVTGAGGPAGVAVIRALQAAGDHVLALDANPDAVGLRLAGRSAVLPRADAPGYGEALLAALAEHRPAALICTVAEEYGALTRLVPHLDELGVRTWLPDPAAADVCLDKIAFATAMHAAGIPHPATAWTAVTTGHIPGPWVVKPARGRGSRDVVMVDDPADLARAFATVPGAIVQTRLSGREFTADALVGRDGTLLACVPRWRDETRGGISTRGTTFESLAVTEVVGATLRAVRHTGPANVQGFVADTGEVTVVEVNPRFSGGLPLTLAAGADVVGAHLDSILDPDTPLTSLGFRPGVRMARHFAEVYYTADGAALPDPFDPDTSTVPGYRPPSPSGHAPSAGHAMSSGHALPAGVAGHAGPIGHLVAVRAGTVAAGR